MYPTRQGWTVAVLATVLAGLAVVFAQPLLLTGAALVGAWLLAHQYRFVQDLERTVESLSVTQSPARNAVQTDEEIPVTLVVTRDTETALTLEVSAGLPIAVTTTDELRVLVEPDSEYAEQTHTLSWPVAGRHTFDNATVTMTDGLFRETITAGSTPTVTVEPPSPQTIHVGEGGDQIAAAYGSHEAGRSGSGIELAELREYVPGDQGKEIDWRATARHATPYVREYEAETDRRTQLVIDHRASLGIGPPAESKLEVLREIALVIAGNARRLNDPLGLLTVGNGGITSQYDIGSPTVNYTSIRRNLLNLEPTPVADVTPASALSGQAAPPPMATGNPDQSSASGGRTTEPSPSTISATANSADIGSSLLLHRTTPSAVHRSLSDLEGTDDTFAQTLRPYYADRQVYRKRIAEDPLYEAVHRGVKSANGAVWTVICTDDTHPAELRETVTVARQGGNEVMVLLAPTVLYEPGGLADIERAYDRYVTFEKFRRELARMDNVRALEVGPADRLSAVLEAGRSRGGRV